MGLLSSELGWNKGWFWSSVASINAHFEYVGYSILGFFGVSMLIAVVLFKCCIKGNGVENDNSVENDNGGVERGVGRGVGRGLGRGVGVGRGLGRGVETKEEVGEERKVGVRAKEAAYLRSRMLAMARGNVQAIDI